VALGFKEGRADGDVDSVGFPDRDGYARVDRLC
jgi:hypothetical protein